MTGGTLTPFKLDLFPQYTVYMGLFTNVTNVKELRGKLLKGELHCALLSTALIPDVMPVLVACNKAVSSYTTSSMKTRNMHTEILYNLSPTKGISEALKTFGVQDKEDNVLLVSLHNNATTFQEDALRNEVEGELTEFSRLNKLCDISSIRTVYKITDDELGIGSYSDALILRVATKEAL